MDFMIFPYGNAAETRKPDGTYSFTCQHGASECTANMIEVCAIHFHNTSWFDFIFCMESSRSPATAGPSCAKSSSWTDYDSNILPCTTSSLGNGLMHSVAQATENLNPPHQWTPWVVMNGKPLTETQLDQELTKLVCAAYTGAKPAACNKYTQKKLQLCPL